MKAYRGEPSIFATRPPQERQAELVVERLTLRFGGITAVSNVDLKVSTGELVSVIGPNGAGKTSLLNCITGYYKAQEGRILFNGNNYSDEWVEEAEKRGLANVRNSVDALKALVTDKAMTLFEKYGVLSHKELHSRYEIYIETYAKQINIEALTAIDMAKKQLIPAAVEYATFLADSAARFKAASIEAFVQEDLLKKLGALIASSYKTLTRLEAAVTKAKGAADCVKKAEIYRDQVVTAMQALRSDIDQMEGLVPTDVWPVPPYAELLFKL